MRLKPAWSPVAVMRSHEPTLLLNGWRRVFLVQLDNAQLLTRRPVDHCETEFAIKALAGTA